MSVSTEQFFYYYPFAGLQKNYQLCIPGVIVIPFSIPVIVIFIIIIPVFIPAPVPGIIKSADKNR